MCRGGAADGNYKWRERERERRERERRERERVITLTSYNSRKYLLKM